MKKYSSEDIAELFKDIPKVSKAFYPTPFHKLENISKKYGVNVFIKREDMSGPSSFGGNKVRKIEYIVGEAVKENVDAIITMGGYQSNASVQLSQYCNLYGIHPIAVLGDNHNEGIPKERKGNLLLNSLLGTEIHLVVRKESPDDPNLNPLWEEVKEKIRKIIADYEAKGKKIMYVPVGCTHPAGWVSYVRCFDEIYEQIKSYANDVDYIFHANGSAGSLPGFIVGKALKGSNCKVISINNRRYGPGEQVGVQDVFDRIKYLYEKFNIECPTDDEIWAEINIDQNYLGEKYGAPTEVGAEAMIEAAKLEGLFLDPVYTGKSFSGLLSYIKSGKIPKGSNVVYIHTGGTGGLFNGYHVFNQKTVDFITREHK